MSRRRATEIVWPFRPPAMVLGPVKTATSRRTLARPHACVRAPQNQARRQDTDRAAAEQTARKTGARSASSAGTTTCHLPAHRHRELASVHTGTCPSGPLVGAVPVRPVHPRLERARAAGL